MIEREQKGDQSVCFTVTKTLQFHKYIHVKSNDSVRRCSSRSCMFRIHRRVEHMSMCVSVCIEECLSFDKAAFNSILFTVYIDVAIVMSE